MKMPNSRLARYGADREQVKSQILAGLEEIEADIRHVQRLVVEDAPCCEVLRETAGVQIVLSRLERALLLCELRECLLQLCDCTPEASTALLEEILEIFSATAQLPHRDPTGEVRR